MGPIVGRTPNSGPPVGARSRKRGPTPRCRSSRQYMHRRRKGSIGGKPGLGATVCAALGPGAAGPGTIKPSSLLRGRCKMAPVRALPGRTAMAGPLPVFFLQQGPRSPAAARGAGVGGSRLRTSRVTGRVCCARWVPWCGGRSHRPGPRKPRFPPLTGYAGPCPLYSSPPLVTRRGWRHEFGPKGATGTSNQPPHSPLGSLGPQAAGRRVTRPGSKIHPRNWNRGTPFTQGPQASRSWAFRTVSPSRPAPGTANRGSKRPGDHPRWPTVLGGARKERESQGPLF